MKWAEAKTNESLVTDTRNSPATSPLGANDAADSSLMCVPVVPMPTLLLCSPSAVEQVHEDRRRGEVGGGTGIVGVPVVAQPPVERRHRAPAPRGAYPAGVHRPAGPPADLGGGFGAELSRDVGVRPGGEQNEVGLDHRLVPRQAARPRLGQRRRTD